MTLPVLLGLGLLGGLGAIARFLLDGTVSDRVGRAFPSGTLAVNLLGSALLGGFAGATLGSDAYRLLGTGLIGAFTTFSTWALESHRLGEDGQSRSGLLNLGISLLLGVLAAWAGRAMGAAL